MDTYDLIVVGLGAMGSSTLYQAAKRGARVLGIEQFSSPHEQGSSHGETRITRLSNGESAGYTRLVRRSHAIWREIEAETGERLLTQCGGLVIAGDSDAEMHVADFFGKTVANAVGNGIAHERLSAAEIRARFPAFHVDDAQEGYYEPEAGFVRPEACIAAQLRLAGEHGAEIHSNERFVNFKADGRGVEIETDRGTYRASTVVATMGGWLAEFPNAGLSGRLAVRRQVLYWFEISGDADIYRPERCPIFIWQLPRSERGMYGFPTLDPALGLKVATEQWTEPATAQTIDRNVTQREIDDMHAMFSKMLPGIGPRCLQTKTCFYTVTDDREFIIDRHPDSDQVILVSACSGHGFKHSAALGEALAELAAGAQPRQDLSPFRISRFAG